MIKTLEKYPILTICLLVAIMLIPNINSLNVTIMEARNFITAREMVLDGNWLLTTMNGEARYEKPPLPTWLTAISSMVFGLKSLFGLRLPAILMVMVTGTFVYLLSNKMLKNASQSLINGLIAITSFYIIGIIIEAPWDIFTHGFMLIGIYHLFQLFEKESQYFKHMLTAGIFIGFSLLCKGPVSMYGLLLPFLLAYGFSYKYKNIRSKVFSILSMVILALSIGGWWYFYVRLQDPETFAAIATKETSNWHSYNVRPFYYYWSFFTQSGIWTIPAFISLIYPYLKSRVTNLKAYKLSLFWTIFAVVLLSIIPEKKSRYLMPVLIPLAINIGFYIVYLFNVFKVLKDKRETIPVYFNFGLIALIGMVFPLVGYYFLDESLSGYLIKFIIASAVLFTIGLFILVHLKNKNIKYVFYLTILFFISLFLFVIPLSQAKIDTNYNDVFQLREANLKQKIKTYSLNSLSPEMIWQYGDRIPKIKMDNSFFNLPEEEQFGLLVNGIINPKDLSHLKEHYTIKQIATYNLNQVQPESKTYRERLVCDYYILNKK
jgi:4-amino-4-deoxy-L-arabinose transferase-like glycosyltransferase